MSEGITNIRIWKSQKYSYNLSENPKIWYRLYQTDQDMIRGMQLMQRKSEMNLVGVQSFDLKKEYKKQYRLIYS